MYDGELKYAVYSSHLTVYDTSDTVVCKFDSGNKLPNVISMLLNGVDDVKDGMEEEVQIRLGV